MTEVEALTIESSFLRQAIELDGGIENGAICWKLFRTFESLGFNVAWDNEKFFSVYYGNKEHYFCSFHNSAESTSMSMYFQRMNDSIRDKLKEALEPIIKIPDEELDKKPRINVMLLNEQKNFKTFVDAIKTYLRNIKEQD